jgi:hypothetical protein
MTDQEMRSSTMPTHPMTPLTILKQQPPVQSVLRLGRFLRHLHRFCLLYDLRNKSKPPILRFKTSLRKQNLTKLSGPLPRASG